MTNFSIVLEIIWAVVNVHELPGACWFKVRTWYMIFTIKIRSTERIFSSELSNNSKLLQGKQQFARAHQVLLTLHSALLFWRGVLFVVGKILIMIWKSAKLMNVEYFVSWLRITPISFVWTELLLTRLFYKCYVCILKFTALVTHEHCA